MLLKVNIFLNLLICIYTESFTNKFKGMPQVDFDLDLKIYFNLWLKVTSHVIKRTQMCAYDLFYLNKKT